MMESFKVILHIIYFWHSSFLYLPIYKDFYIRKFFFFSYYFWEMLFLHIGRSCLSLDMEVIYLLIFKNCFLGMLVWCSCNNWSLETPRQSLLTCLSDVSYFCGCILCCNFDMYLWFFNFFSREQKWTKINCLVVL